MGIKKNRQLNVNDTTDEKAYHELTKKIGHLKTQLFFGKYMQSKRMVEHFRTNIAALEKELNELNKKKQEFNDEFHQSKSVYLANQNLFEKNNKNIAAWFKFFEERENIAHWLDEYDATKNELTFIEDDKENLRKIFER